MELRKNIGKLIRYHRDRLGVTQEQLARQSGVDVSYLSYVENGKRNVSLDVLERILSVLQIKSYDEIFSSIPESGTKRDEDIRDIVKIMSKMDDETLSSLHRILSMTSK